MGDVLQISTLLRVVPSWLPLAAVALGFFLLSVGMAQRYYDGMFDRKEGLPPFRSVTVLSLALSVGGATYVSIQRRDLALLFVFFTFVSGRIIQGAISARFLQRVLDFLLSAPSDPDARYLVRAYRYLKKKLKERALMIVVVGTISLHTALSIIAVYAIGSGDVMEAIERFWAGFFFLVVAGLVFDFRHFAHRISWTAAAGLVIAVTGAFLYSPLGFSTFTGALAPYLQNPIPDWMRWPLGAIGFVFGVVFWAIFYTKER